MEVGNEAGQASRPAASIRASGQDRLAYLREVCELLWPAPTAVSLTGGWPAGSEDATLARTPASTVFTVLPAAGRPRLLVPSPRRAAAAAVRGYGEPGSLVTRTGSKLLPVLLRSGIGRVTLRDRLEVRAPAGADTIQSYLRAVLGHDVVLSMHLGAARANRKPVLQLLSQRGEHVGFAKISVNPLTSDLVRCERDALARLGHAGLRRLTHPTVMHYGRWRGLDVLVLSALPVWRRRRRLSAGLLTAAMTELAGIDGIAPAPLAGSGYWQRLTSRVLGVDAGAPRAALLDALSVVAARAGSTMLPFGAWHGDWTPWNMASTDHGLLVWDWERFTRGVPAGFDALHHWLAQALTARRREPAAAAAGCAAAAPALVAPFGVDAVSARLVALLYLAELASRYLADRQDEAGARLGTPGTWLIPAVKAGVATL